MILQSNNSKLQFDETRDDFCHSASSFVKNRVKILERNDRSQEDSNGRFSRSLVKGKGISFEQSINCPSPKSLNATSQSKNGKVFLKRHVSTLKLHSSSNQVTSCADKINVTNKGKIQTRESEDDSLTKHTNFEERTSSSNLSSLKVENNVYVDSDCRGENKNEKQMKNVHLKLRLTPSEKTNETYIKNKFLKHKREIRQRRKDNAFSSTEKQNVPAVNFNQCDHKKDDTDNDKKPTPSTVKQKIIQNTISQSIDNSCAFALIKKTSGKQRRREIRRNKKLSEKNSTRDPVEEEKSRQVKSDLHTMPKQLKQSVDKRRKEDILNSFSLRKDADAASISVNASELIREKKTSMMLRRVEEINFQEQRTINAEKKYLEGKETEIIENLDLSLNTITEKVEHASTNEFILMKKSQSIQTNIINAGAHICDRKSSLEPFHIKLPRGPEKGNFDSLSSGTSKRCLNENPHEKKIGINEEKSNALIGKTKGFLLDDKLEASGGKTDNSVDADEPSTGDVHNAVESRSNDPSECKLLSDESSSLHDDTASQPIVLEGEKSLPQSVENVETKNEDNNGNEDDKYPLIFEDKEGNRSGASGTCKLNFNFAFDNNTNKELSDKFQMSMKSVNHDSGGCRSVLPALSIQQGATEKAELSLYISDDEENLSRGDSRISIKKDESNQISDESSDTSFDVFSEGTGGNTCDRSTESRGNDPDEYNLLANNQSSLSDEISNYSSITEDELLRYQNLEIVTKSENVDEFHDDKMLCFRKEKIHFQSDTSGNSTLSLDFSSNNVRNWGGFDANDRFHTQTPFHNRQNTAVKSECSSRGEDGRDEIGIVKEESFCLLDGRSRSNDINDDSTFVGSFSNNADNITSVAGIGCHSSVTGDKNLLQNNIDSKDLILSTPTNDAKLVTWHNTPGETIKQNDMNKRESTTLMPREKSITPLDVISALTGFSEDICLQPNMFGNRTQGEKLKGTKIGFKSLLFEKNPEEVAFDTSIVFEGKKTEVFLEDGDKEKRLHDNAAVVNKETMIKDTINESENGLESFELIVHKNIVPWDSFRFDINTTYRDSIVESFSEDIDGYLSSGEPHVAVEQDSCSNDQKHDEILRTDDEECRVEDSPVKRVSWWDDEKNAGKFGYGTSSKLPIEVENHERARKIYNSRSGSRIEGFVDHILDHVSCKAISSGRML